MGRPSLRRIREKTFCSGDTVRANDGALLAELQGNAAKRENISEFNTYHNMTFPVLAFNPESFDISAGVTDAEGTGIVWLHRVPRSVTLKEVHIYNMRNQFTVNPGLKLELSLIRTDEFPSVPQALHADMGDVIDDFTLNTSAATGDTTLSVGSGVTSSPDTLLKANDFLFLYSTFRLNPDAFLTDFGGLRQRMILNVSLRFQEEHV